MSNENLLEQAASRLVRESGAVIVFLILAVPGFFLVDFVFSASTEFYVIALVGAGGHVTLRRMSERDRSVETDISGIEAWKAVVLLLILTFIAVITVSVRLGLGTLVGMYVTTLIGKSLVAVLAAAVTPVFDYLLGERHWWASPSGLVTGVLTWVLVALVSRVNSEAAENIQSDARRIDPM
jgi:hypothetical protein